MDTNVLRWFQLVADGATVTEVSELEWTSQPGISRALARLSDEVGAPLLRREGRVLRLTHAGAMFKHHVDAMLHQLDDGLAEVAQLMDPESGLVTVAFPHSLGEWLVPAIAAGFLQRHPDVQLDLSARHDETTPATGTGSEIDLELTTLRPRGRAHHWRGLLREPLRLLLPEGHPLTAGTAPVPITRIGGERLITMRRTSQLWVVTDSLLSRHGIEPEAGLVADDLPTLYGYVAAGLGVALAPGRAVAGVRPQALAEDDAFREIGLSWAAGRRLLPSTALFRDHVLGLAKSRRLPHPPETVDVEHHLRSST
ncbi:LysR family transcriptional regulator [[Pseudopropionibacterium] massiliense]|uniref:LysR family transcriptional regulator n=1 Tax=[Pseudopropionibacterium] massiliense TaxID=2220000 RepID=UPI00102FFD49|nr:LysR substrate-binding domain-containing protein [[Pseudopropionibacterium] massiliense]